MPPHPHRPPALAWQVFRGSDVVRQGLATRHQLRGSSWIRLRHDVYADARLDRDHALACRAAALRLPPEAVIAGPSAAYLHGVEHAAGFDDDVHVLVPKACRVDSRRRLRVHLLGAADAPSLPPVTNRRDGIELRRTDPTSAAWETAVWLDPLRAVPIVDSLLAGGLTTQAALSTVGTANADRPGGRRARWVFGLADPGAQSPPESQLRVRLVLGGLPRPVTRQPIRVAGGLVLHPDLAWPEFRVALEYDGRWHSDPQQLHRDRRRLNLLVGAGWLVLHVTSRRLHGEFPAVLSEVRAALIGRGWRR
ncbi:hypothetical protein FHG89_04490 [Micromonospora orduensis]|uniref:DUF559 domain-containing protein n=1 Tax=Micromonospora orduensis TaxID=1420891 RepID=A0A5C4QY87_9ACTN|nr:hypothetical protein [Micromonospora orduensis]TNH31051.1 hypothetical protein FHG89_04490 [Micromonospora orduensis]